MKPVWGWRGFPGSTPIDISMFKCWHYQSGDDGGGCTGWYIWKDGRPTLFPDWSDDEKNAHELGLANVGVNAPVFIHGAVFERLGADPDTDAILPVTWTHRRAEAAAALRNSGRIYYSPEWGWVVETNAFHSVLQPYMSKDSFFEKVMSNLPIILGVALTAGAISGALTPYTVAEAGAIAGGEAIGAAGGFLTDAELAELAILDVTEAAAVTAPELLTEPLIESVAVESGASAGEIAAAPQSTIPPVSASPSPVPPPSGISLPSAGTIAKQALPLAMKLFAPNAAPSGAARSLTGQTPQVNYQDPYGEQRGLTTPGGSRILVIGGGLLAAAFAVVMIGSRKRK